MRLLVLVATSTLLLTGCLGIGGDDDGADGNETDDDGGTNETPGNETNETPDFRASPPGKEWDVDNRSGSVDGMSGAVVMTGAEETFTVDDGAERLFLAVNSSAGDGEEAPELTVEIEPPSCAEGPATAPVTGCPDAESGETSGGSYSFSADGPEAGEWTISLFCSDPGPCMADYDLVVAQLVAMNETEEYEDN